MPTVFQHRRHDSEEVQLLIGAPGELIIDQEQNLGRGELTLHDGITAGGLPISPFRISADNTFIYTTEIDYNIAIGKIGNEFEVCNHKLDVNGSICFVGTLNSNTDVTTIWGLNIINLGTRTNAVGNNIFVSGFNNRIDVECCATVIGNHNEMYGDFGLRDGFIFGNNNKVYLSENIVIGFDGNTDFWQTGIGKNITIAGRALALPDSTYTGDIKPRINQEYDIGSITRWYWDGYIVNLHFENLVVGETNFYPSKPQYFKFIQASTSSSQISLPTIGLAKSVRLLVDHTEWIIEDDYTEVLNENGHATAINPIFDIPKDSVVVIRYNELISSS